MIVRRIDAIVFELSAKLSENPSADFRYRVTLAGEL